jgi:preprotein translocase subunit SecG
MSGLLLTLHVIVSLLLIGVILLQPGSKGGGLGATFGGGGANSAFGAQGAAPFLAKFTYWLAAGFMITSLVIEVLIVKQNRSVLDRAGVVKTVQPKPAPAAPAVPIPATPAAPDKK